MHSRTGKVPRSRGKRAELEHFSEHDNQTLFILGLNTIIKGMNPAA